jgi:cell fate (sporulation/competence/biofilm development) regulator YlbF (YheA/YmcA/DUF963 family)
MILDQARELGIQLSETEEFKNMLLYRAELESNESICSVLREFQEKQAELMEVLAGENPDRMTVASLSRDVEMLQEQLLENDLFSQAIKAQNAFQLLMQQVNREIAACIGFGSEDSGNGCDGGSCEGCSGCKH